MLAPVLESERKDVPVNVAARAGRWSAAHWKTATFGWLALVAVAVMVGAMVGTVALTDAQQGTGESARAQAMLIRGGFGDHAGENVLVQSRTLTASAPAFRDEVARVTARLSPVRQIQDVRSPQISRDGQSALIEFQIKGSPDTAGDRIEPVLNTVAALQRGASGYTVAEFGDASGDHAQSQETNRGLARAETLSLPITFLVLLVLPMVTVPNASVCGLRATCCLPPPGNNPNTASCVCVPMYTEPLATVGTVNFTAGPGSSASYSLLSYS